MVPISVVLPFRLTASPFWLSVGELLLATIHMSSTVIVTALYAEASALRRGPTKLLSIQILLQTPLSDDTAVVV